MPKRKHPCNYRNAEAARAAGLRVILGVPVEPPAVSGWGEHFALTEDISELPELKTSDIIDPREAWRC